MSETLIRAGGTTGRPASARQLRRWVRRRQVATLGSIGLETVYLAVLAAAMTVALFGPPLGRTLWPAGPLPDPHPLTVVALVGVGAAGLLAALRRLGPVVIGRPDASWLLASPVPRRGLLLPPLARVLALASLLGAAGAGAGVARLAARPVDVGALLGWATAGAAGGALLATAATAGQRDPAWARRLDRLVAAVLLGGGAAALVAPEVPAPRVPAPAAALLWGAATVAVTAAALAVAGTVRRLDAFPDRRLRGTATLVGAHLDAVYAVEPSYLSDLWERRSWQGRRLRSTPVRRPLGLPVEVAHDLLVLRRKRRRLGWLAAATLLPALLADAPGWLLALVVCAGALGCADTTLDAVRRDGRQPALLRLTGRTGRQVVAARFLTPAVLATLWSAVALTGLAVRSGLPPGPWCLLGLAVGPAVAAAALRRARSRPVDHSMPMVDTPMGSFTPGPLIWLLTGPDLLVVLALPTLAAMLDVTGTGGPGPARLLLQAALSALGAAAYLLLGADRRRSLL
ncbi:DUF6297 family protein [Micromonospora sp. NPDC050686]|uniref:DUF6297 family protein n=1 Tax=Micromonospora sp. NPDC050686 TaxID=3154631 RepID=UPI0033FD26F1